MLRLGTVPDMAKLADFTAFLHAVALAAALSLCTACQSSPAPEPTNEAPVAQQTEGGEAAPAVEAPAEPNVTGVEVTYSAEDGTPLKGYLAYDASITEPRPGVLVVHEWWGHNDYVRKRADMLAKLGYVALALDMYGEGKHTQHPAEAKQFMQEATSNIEASEKRFLAAFELLKQNPHVDGDKIAAIGYCFGGGVILHMARVGAPLAGVASFHGNLAGKATAEPGTIKSKILVMTGAADPFVPEEQVAAFEKEMTTAGADFRVVRYSGAKHGFTNPEATAMGQAAELPLAYDAEADAASWAELQGFLDAIFAKG